MEFDEELIKKIKNRIEFNKTKSELLIELVNKTGKVGNNLKKHLGEINKQARFLRKNCQPFFKINKINKTFSPNIKSDEIVAIDGSSNIGGQLSGKFISLYSVAQIHLKLDKRNKLATTEKYWGDMEIIDALDEKEIEKKLELKMIRKETEAYENSINLFGKSCENKFIFIDGPIIDPPNHKDKDYVNFRTDIIRKVLKKKIILVGCVKRIFGKNFLRFIGNNFEEKETKNKIYSYLNDRYLISSLVTDYRKKHNFHGTLISDFYQNEPKKDTAEYYYNLNGIYIKSLFFQYSTKHRLLRVDIPFLKFGKDYESNLLQKIKNSLMGFSYPGIDLPYPVHLAHEFSKIRDGCAETIYDDIITKNLSNKPINQIFINMLK